MKKWRILTAIVTALVLLVTVLFYVISVVFYDEIIHSEEREFITTTTMAILHETESGSEISIPVTVEYTEAGNDTYRIYIFVSQTDDRKYYDAENLNLRLELSEKLEIISVSRFWGEGKNRSSKVQGSESPDVPPENGVKVLEYETESCYMILDVYVKGETAEPAVLKLQYDIDGKGRYMFNHFDDWSHAFEIALQQDNEA
ncbi:MAG: hypothetical protein IJ496_01085 [Ruminococcus sp.]|nr:hypothetical protein [Ruminococcus sp.]